MGEEERKRHDEKWDGVLRREASIVVRSVDEERRSVRFLVSNDAIDSHGDIVEQDWILDRYKKNPVVLWAHNRYGAPDEVVIGRAENVEVTSSGLEADLVFAPAELSKTAQTVYGMVKGGFLKATSVGFRPHKVRLAEDDDGRELYLLSRNELMEISVVPIPSNPDAVAKSLHRDEEREFLRRMAGCEPSVSRGDVQPEGHAVADEPKESSHMDKTEKAIEDAKVKAAAAEKVAEDLRTELKAAKAEQDALQKSLDAEKEARQKAEARAEAAEAVTVEKEIDALVGVKFYPAERDEQLELAKSIGIDRVKAIASKRPDITLTEDPAIEGKALGQSKPAPAPVDGVADLSKDLHERALAKAQAAVGS